MDGRPEQIEVLEMTSPFDLRKEYKRGGLHETDLDADPVAQFAAWFSQAQETLTTEPTAMILATASADGAPSARTVLLKGFDDRGFVFYTNYESAKGHALTENPRAALLFYWPELERQIRISGEVERMTREESERYFRSRPPGSQIAAAVSRQSEVVPSREWLHEAYARMEAEYEGRNVPMPDDWGGYRVAPAVVEFWQGRPNRLHDRLRYTRRPEGGWLVERLSP